MRGYLLVLNVQRFDLSKHRLEIAIEDYKAAVINLDSGLYKAANNRAYYSIFHAMRAVIALDAKDFKKHSAVISYFTQHFINTGALNKELSKIIAKAGTIRNLSDYEDFYIANKTETKAQVESAKIFYEAVGNYLTKQFCESE